MQLTKIIIVFILSTLFVLSEDTFSTSFITKYEYGKMLYQKPRGISCAKCHGIDAKGKNIISFTHITKSGKKYKCSIQSPDITKVDFELFKATLDPNIEKPKKRFKDDQICEKLTYGNSMPTYFLTSQELDSIYYYLINQYKYKK